MIIHNPTDTKVTITIGGITKEVEPMSDIEVAESFGEKWVKTHAFLQKAAEVAKVVAQEMKEVREEIEDVVEEVKDVVEVVDKAIEEVVKEVKKAKKK